MYILKDPPNTDWETLNLNRENLILWKDPSTGLPRWPGVKNPPANADYSSSTPESGSSPGEGNGNPFQYSCLENPMDRGAWQATIHGVARSITTTIFRLQISSAKCIFITGKIFLKSKVLLKIYTISLYFN